MIFDNECAMPAAMQRRNHELNLHARVCYGLRNAEIGRSNLGRARDYEDMGDVYAARAMAITAEWEEAL